MNLSAFFSDPAVVPLLCSANRNLGSDGLPAQTLYPLMPGFVPAGGNVTLTAWMGRTIAAAAGAVTLGMATSANPKANSFASATHSVTTAAANMAATTQLLVGATIVSAGTQVSPPGSWQYAVTANTTTAGYTPPWWMHFLNYTGVLAPATQVSGSSSFAVTLPWPSVAVLDLITEFETPVYGYLRVGDESTFQRAMEWVAGLSLLVGPEPGTLMSMEAPTIGAVPDGPSMLRMYLNNVVFGTGLDVAPPDQFDLAAFALHAIIAEPTTLVVSGSGASATVTRRAGNNFRWQRLPSWMCVPSGWYEVGDRSTPTDVITPTLPCSLKDVMAGNVKYATMPVVLPRDTVALALRGWNQTGPYAVDAVPDITTTLGIEYLSVVGQTT